MPFAYTPDMPVASHLPAADQPLMNANSQYLKDFGDRDHEFTQNSATPGIDGYHKQITFAKNQTTPSFTSTAVSVAYANAAGAVPQSQIFFNNAVGDAQLTSVAAAIPGSLAVPTVAANGATFLPGTAALGGLLLQWGSGVAATPVVFPVAFSVAVFAPIVTVTPVSASTASCTVSPVVTAFPSGTGFTVSNNAGQLFAFFWMAIGQAA